MRGSWVAGLAVLLWLAGGPAAAAEGPWTLETPARDGAEAVYRLELDRLRSTLARAPLEDTEAARASSVELSLPLPDGRFVRFAVVESPVLEPALAAEFPEIKTYAGTALDAPGTITRFDLGPRGFHAIVLGPGITAFVEPEGERYVSRRSQGGAGSAPRCEGHDLLGAAPAPVPSRVPAGGVTTRQGDRRIYHLVGAATAEFTAANGGTVGSALAAITTSINGVNAIYRRDVGIHLELIAASTSVIFTDTSTSPYTSGDFSCEDVAPSCAQPLDWDCLLTENQCVVDAFVGNGNYDLAIVFDNVTRRGRAQGYSVCNTQTKARAATSPEVGVVAHEIGHMFGAWHTFNGTSGTCAGNRDQDHAFEPGSGSTIMSYAGNCGDENLQDDFDLFFHHQSFLEIVTFSTGAGDVCAGWASTGNYAPVVQSWTAGPYTIPKGTPFSLSVQAYDPQDDPITYSWEQADTGGASPPVEDDGTRPIFRAYAPTTDPERWFPLRDTVFFRDNIPPDTVGCPATIFCQSGETLPNTTRTMHYNVTLRDGQDGVTVAYSTVASDAGSGPFKVTQPVGTDRWTQGAWREVRWDVANTNQPPVSCSHVRILLSTDLGETFAYVLAGSTPNDGSEMVLLPFDTTPLARIRIESIGNIFFDISESFTIEELKVTNLGDSGHGSLRQAILDANAYPFGATIPLQLPGTGVRTIPVLSPLPALGSDVALEAWDIGGPEYVGPPLLELDGSACAVPQGQTCDGLTLTGVDAYVNGVIVNRFSGNGIALRGSGSRSNLVQNCYIGTSADGTADAGNGGSGVLIDGGWENLLWGNVISGNKVGVTIQGATATANHLQRNKIGTNQAGTARIPNDDDGVRIVNAPGNTVGGPGNGNVISGNGRFNPGNAFVETSADGVDISGATAGGNVVQGNYFGLNAAGTAGLDNTDTGVRIQGAPNTLVGGTTAGARNVFADSSFINFFFAHAVYVQGTTTTGTVIQGNFMGLDATGTVELGIRGAGVYAESPGVQIGGTTPGARNVMANLRGYGGIYLQTSAGGAQIRGNYIGTDASGSVNFGTPVTGITALSGSHTIVGNVIAGAQVGIDIRENGASNNVIQGNLIGLDAGGTQDFGNTTIGIQLIRSGGNLIGGTTPAERNVVSGNDQFGIHVAGPPGPAGTNTIQGNYIGTNASGTAAVPNGIGVSIYETVNATVGGAAAGAGNVISGNGAYGVDVLVSDPASGLVVQGNLIGTDAAGTAALPNGGTGLHVGVNGPITIAGNVISGNAQHGLEICCRPTTGTMQGNFVGTDRTGTLDLRNGWSGMALVTGNNTVDGSVVAFNGGPGTGFNFAGIRLGASGTHRIRGNAIFGNTGLGVDFGFSGPEANDACDPDTGPNGHQNHPLLTSATRSGPSTVVTGTLNSTPSTAFAVDLYASPSCDPSGYGEGAVPVGTVAVTTDGSCNGSFTATIPGNLSGVVTAIAVAPNGSTSEFSACAAVQPSAIAEVGALTWPGKNELSWPAAAGASQYRVLRGVRGDLGKLLDQSEDSCERAVVAASGTGPMLTEDPVAVAGRLYWYLVVGINGPVEGPAGDATAGPRLANVSGACP